MTPIVAIQCVNSLTPRPTRTVLEPCLPICMDLWLEISLKERGTTKEQR